MSKRSLSYAEAIREAMAQLLASDPRVFVIGQGLWSPWYVGASMKDLDRDFGRDRIIDSPVSENATTGAAVGAALAGMRPIMVHPRMDFMLLAMDPIVNQAANWSYLFAGQVSVPIVIRPIINRGGQQAAQHSQALQAFFQHVPGLKLVMPSTPYDAKGLLMAAVADDNPVMYIDDRWLYQDTGEVPEEPYEVQIGQAAVRREGKDVTVVASSFMAAESEKAGQTLSQRGIDAEVIDLRSIKPWDREAIIASVRKTGRLVVADGTYAEAGVAAEIAATVASACLKDLEAPIARVALPNTPAPTSATLEAAYYPKAQTVVAAVEASLGKRTLPNPYRSSASVPGSILID
ncbi:MAG: alpha-ketoacid dehydrogenase subunit beta [Planctomycetota bacterium]|jgi:pyruvate dehydrogenase E1 component beta subunit